MWLPIIEYSVKTGLSLSTIRRKIKSNSIPFRLEKGRYLILHRFSSDGVVPQKAITIHQEEPQTHLRTRLSEKSEAPNSIAVRALEELLRDRDQRIQQLEKRNRELENSVAELKTLVDVLEEKYAVRY